MDPPDPSSLWVKEGGLWPSLKTKPNQISHNSSNKLWNVLEISKLEQRHQRLNLLMLEAAKKKKKKKKSTPDKAQN